MVELRANLGEVVPVTVVLVAAAPAAVPTEGTASLANSPVAGCLVDSRTLRKTTRSSQMKMRTYRFDW